MPSIEQSSEVAGYEEDEDDNGGLIDVSLDFVNGRRTVHVLNHVYYVHIYVHTEIYIFLNIFRYTQRTHVHTRKPHD